ncbi:E3 ubiquitin/ISG15 ligase TRIM25-like [Megalops cyprinoides]|uniref:E3 ubiquitin/ISG15 ligase TRIM25-like n=1 Tax=Megalops cyprinoides TaxID=118141 RepID=UPI001864749B|nr:E3 ubiquitin/ISG15 ligase TRIM25-like [Megalops cyprinoides]
MAEAGDVLDQKQFNCPICLDLLKDPVAIPCGHSYCMDCIKGCWDQDDHTGVYSCPQCRQTFAPRPVLGRNTMLAEVVEKLKKTGLQAAPPAHCYAGPGDVACDVCTGRKLKAVKSCLMCMVSYCETHLQPHYESTAFKMHKLVNATEKLQENMCPNHNRLLEVYCRSDQLCICCLCVLDEHKGHDTVSAEEERIEKQNQLAETQRKFQQRIQEREKELQDLRQAVESLTRSAQAAVEDSETIVTEFIFSIERKHSEMKELIRDQEEATVTWSVGVIDQLETEIAKLKRRDAEMEQLSHTEDHINFLQSCQPLCIPPGCGGLPSITMYPNVSFGFVKKSVSELKGQLEDIYKEQLAKIFLKVKDVNLLPTPGPKTRAEFLQYSCQLTLDPDTAFRELLLSEENREATRVREKQPYPDHPERFTAVAQVLCREGLSGRCYWEAEWSGEGVAIAVSYKEISRRGKRDNCFFGCNEKSWSFYRSASCYSSYYKTKQTYIPVPPSSKIGVYLDHRAGTLCFYSVSDTMTLLYRVQATFTQPLYPGFGFGVGSAVKLCPLCLSVTVCSKMAAASISVDQDQFSCSICLDLLKDPVTIPCVHSYCMDCIKGYWDQGDQTGVYSCPQCRETFNPRPVLRRNTILAEVVEKLKMTGLQAAPPAHCYAGPGDVACDVCTGRKRKAVKSCLECLASYCETHLILHDELNRGKSHKLIEATGNLQEKICSQHCKLLEVYCRTDQQFICCFCMINEHRGHDTVSFEAERTEKQKQLGETQRKFQQRVQEREKELQDLRQAVPLLMYSAQAAVEDSERIFTELICSIERRRSEVKELIINQENAKVALSVGLIAQLELEIAELRRRDAELEQLSHTQDHIHFLRSCQSLCVPPGCGDLPRNTVNLNVFFGFVKKFVSQLKERLEDICKEELAKISLAVKNVDPLQAPEPMTRAEFLQYSCQLTLDPNTAHTYLCLSEGNGAVTQGAVKQPYPDHPERFDFWPQVLCREGLSGCCYWEAEWSGAWVSMAVSYKEISRKGNEHDCCFGLNEKSWRLRCSASEYSFCHDNDYTVIPAPPSSRIGVYLDHRAGTLSFYSVSDTMTLLHRVQTTFTQPLYPGFIVASQSTVKLCPLE